MFTEEEATYRTFPKAKTKVKIRNKIKARLLNLFTFRVCSMPGCNSRAIAQISFSQYLCKEHMNRMAVGRLALEEERERRRKAAGEHFLETVEPDSVLKDIEKLGLENYDPETDLPKDMGRMMHQKKKEE